jgi:uncharacterized phosphosugar-binding protein
MKTNLTLDYCEKTQEVLNKIAQSQTAAIETASCWVADTIQKDGLVYTLGSGHSLVIAAEMYYRAGGLANFDVIHDKTFGRAERLPGYASVLLDAYPITSNDLVVIVSNSGRNPLPVEMALEAKKRMIRTIGITSLAHSRAVSSRSSTGLRLFEACDLVIDNCGSPGDCSLEVGDGQPIRVGPTSTLAGVFIANWIMCTAIQELINRGVKPKVFASANLDQGDDHNRELINFLRHRTRGL